MIKKTDKVHDPIFDIFQVVQDYKKRGINTILLTIPQIDDLLDYAGYRASDPMMIHFLENGVTEVYNKDSNHTPNTHIKTQQNFDKNKNKVTKKGR
tara:strand:- start:1023 stop:1310 length:288 start_codon:yes stop_codon:yes gene_type:complete